jgi:hypothetical protein
VETMVASEQRRIFPTRSEKKVLFYLVTFVAGLWLGTAQSSFGMIMISSVEMKAQINKNFPKEVEQDDMTAAVLKHESKTIVPITEDGIVEDACDFRYKTRKKHDLDSGSEVTREKSIICTIGVPDILNPFFSEIVPYIKVNFTLVTVEHDQAIPHDFSILDKTENLLAWFGWNIGIYHPKLACAPDWTQRGPPPEDLRSNGKA